MKLNDFEKRWLTQAVAEAEITNSNLLEIGFETEVDYESDKFEELVVEHGIKIAEKEGFIKTLDTWITRTRTLGLFSIVLIFMIGFVSAFNFHESSNTREINALLSILIILTPNIVMMLLWFFGFLIQARRPIGIAPFWEWLISHIPGAHKQLVGSFLKLHDQGNLTRWWLGCITHRFWTFITLGVLIGLASALAFRGYEFVWESTWLTDETFIIIINTLGIIPSYLGFTVPENPVYILSSYANELKSSGVTEIDNYTNLENRRAWTFWLLGCIFVYGLIPRIILWMMCSANLKIGRVRLRLNTEEDSLHKLINLLKIKPSSSTLDSDINLYRERIYYNDISTYKASQEKNEINLKNNNIHQKSQQENHSNIHPLTAFINKKSHPFLHSYFEEFQTLAYIKNRTLIEFLKLFFLTNFLYINFYANDKQHTPFKNRILCKIVMWFFQTKKPVTLFIITAILYILHIGYIHKAFTFIFFVFGAKSIIYLALQLILIWKQANKER